MKLKIVAVIAALALFAIPGSASQPDAGAQRLAAMQQDMGFALDPHPAQDFSISLPKSFKDVVAF